VFERRTVFGETAGCLLKEYRIGSYEDLLVDVGIGRRLAVLVARALVTAGEDGPGRENDEKTMRPLVIKGTEGMVMHFAKCCRPIPGDPVVGLITAGRGMVIHTTSCRNLREHRHPAENYIDVQWEPGIDEEYPVEIGVLVADRRGVLATVAAAIGNADSNIENVGMEERDGMTNTLLFTISVRSRQHLARSCGRCAISPP
jgi:(p)ppGpp synthase/HD superfamily hydrolase